MPDVIGRIKWRDDYYLKAYQLAAQGLSNKDIAEGIGCGNPDTFRRWCKRRPALRRAIDAGRAAQPAQFNQFVIDRLPAKLRALWHKLNTLADDDRTGPEMVEALFAGHGERTRQHLFLYAYLNSNFNPSRACALVGITRKRLATWVEQDPDFCELFRELDHHKKDWLEDALMKLVAAGETSAVLFANRCKNRDRGYDNKQTVEVTGSIEHNHNLLDLDSLDLPPEVHVAILEAVRRKKEGLPALPAPAGTPGVITVAGFEAEAPAA